MDIVWANWMNQPDAYRAMEKWASERIYGKPKPFGMGTAMGVMEDNQPIAAMIFYDYDDDAKVIQISGASDTPRWLTKKTLWELFNFPFNDLGCQSVVMRVDPEDKRLGRILPAYGFKKHILPNLRGKGKDDAIYILSDDDWKMNKFHSNNT